MEDKYKALREPITMIYSEPMVWYMACDGKKFKCPIECSIYEKPLLRRRHYNYLLERRNWFERFFNIKPNMDYYDSLG